MDIEELQAAIDRFVSDESLLLDWSKQAIDDLMSLMEAARLVANPNIEAAWKVLTEVVDIYLGDDEALAFVTDIVAAALTPQKTPDEYPCAARSTISTISATAGCARSAS